ncbi:MAG: DUF3883 domain-containing protein [Ignavibacteria bacterium]|nr:DUF3883 domain-containing protein [Ignavibacteria bacterium]
MLEKLLEFNKLGNKTQLFTVLKSIYISTKISIDDLKSFCIVNSFAISASIDGILSLFEFLNYIKYENYFISINLRKFTKFNINESFFTSDAFILDLLNSLKRENALVSIFNSDSIKYNSNEKIYYIKENIIPYKYLAIKNLFVSIGFLDRSNDFEFIIVNKIYNQLFEDSIISYLITTYELNSKNKLPLSKLKFSLKNREDQGRTAENFVLEFEKKRLAKHYLLHKVKIISDDFVDVGYDIQSYEDLDSILIDRFIEVKSFSNDFTFYWSKKQIDVAQELTDKYFLYLVDINKIKDKSYLPSIFQNPYNKIFQNKIWKKEIEKWKITLID